MKKTLLVILIVAIVAGGGAFYAGLKYGQHKKFGRGDVNFADWPSAGRQAPSGQLGFGGGEGKDLKAGGGFIAGEIISKDDKSITVKLSDGGSKIIFFGESTEVNKFVSGATSDLEIGKTVTVSGKKNDDGSITAQTIQIRPETPK
ncbi:MAG: DUF5666 domain-containing protein [Patescibacteria group bacterium]|nr:DUF5666 domain-containing protein [Patescibacteria group bacterium]MDD5490621.1 DUF5666 domain-containing protein [Patescibacteria group bacterium]